MLNQKGIRELAYIVIIDDIEPIIGSDNCECAVINGWHIMVRKNEFKKGDVGIYFEIDSYLDSTNPAFSFMEKKKYKVKTQRYTFGGKGNFISQGLLMSAEQFGWHVVPKCEPLYHTPYIVDNESHDHHIENESRFLTVELGVTYAEPGDNKRKAAPADPYKSMAQRHGKLFSHQPYRWLMKRTWGKKLLFKIYGKKKEIATHFPTHFPYIKKTDQERCENMVWVLKDKTPFIVTQKCDGSSGTFILERKGKKKFEFYVCSRNVRQLTPAQKSYYDNNYYWECAIKYDIENKLKDYLIKHPDLQYVCWQGEVCGPGIQSNPQGLTETHLFCFHMIDSKIGKYDMRDAAKIWKSYDMEVVPIVDINYILPDDFDEFKLSADGYYDPACCEGKNRQEREGFVYYKTTDPNFSFKNVSREYLLKK